MSKKKSSFIAKLLKKVSCIHLPADSVVSEEEEEEDVSHHEQAQQQQQQPPKQKPQQLVIAYGGVGVDEGSMKGHKVPSKYVAYSATLRALLERSGEELETILSRGWVVIRCEIAEFESTLKFVEGLMKAKERVKTQPKLWAPRSKKSSLENSR